MLIGDGNTDCLFHCAESILQCKISGFSSFKDLSLFYRMLNEQSSDNCDIERLLERLSEIFKSNIEKAIEIIDKENLSDFEISKILLLVIVVYILMSNSVDKSNKLIKLCDSIPIRLHENACKMFAPFLIKFSDKIPIKKDDLNNALSLNDKENQTSYFSPVREVRRTHLVNDKIVFANKQRIHHELQMSQSVDLFPMVVSEDESGCSSSGSQIESASPLVKLVQMVQSPDLRQKMQLTRQQNRELERNVNNLQHELLMSASFETQLDRTIKETRQRVSELERELKQAQATLRDKEDTINDLQTQLNQHIQYSDQCKRMEARVRLSEDRENEFQLLNDQLDEKCEENKKLKIENRESSHFRSLAIERRLQIENLMNDISQYKLAIDELNETRVKLKETETQLAELQHQIHCLQTPAKLNDSLSEVSLSSSLCNPESMYLIAEMERDELKNELNLLKEQMVSKEMYESAKEQINNLQEEIDESMRRFNEINSEQDAIVEYYRNMKENIDQGKAFEFNSNGSLKSVKQIMNEMNKTISDYKGRIDQLLASNSTLGDELNEKTESESDLKTRIELLMKELETKNQYLTGVGEILFKGETYDVDGDNYLMNMTEKILLKDELNQRCNETILHFKHNFEKVKAMCKNNFQIIKETLEDAKQSNESNVSAFLSEIDLLKMSLLDSSIEMSSSSPFIKSLYEFNQNLKEKSNEVTLLNKKIHDLQLKNITLTQNFDLATAQHYQDLNNLKDEMNKRNYENSQEIIRNLSKEFDEVKNALLAKHSTEEIEMKNDISRLIVDYQECLTNMDNLSENFEEKIRIKDNQYDHLKKTTKELEQEVMLLKNEIIVINKEKECMSLSFNEIKQELSLLQRNLDEKSEIISRKEEKIIELDKVLNAVKEANQFYSEKIKNDQLVQKNIEQKNKEFEKFSKETIEKNIIELEQYKNENNRLMMELTATKNEITANINSHSDERLKMMIEIDKKDAEITNFQQKIEENNKQLQENEKLICELQNLLTENRDIQRSTLNDLENLKSVVKQNDEMKQNYEISNKKLLEMINKKEEEFKSTTLELERVNNAFKKLDLDVSSKNEKIELLLKEISKITEEFNEIKLQAENNLAQKDEEVVLHKKMLEEKENESSGHKNKLTQLENWIEESKIREQDLRIEIDYLTVMDERYVELTKDYQKLEKQYKESKMKAEESLQLKETEISILKSNINSLQEKENQTLKEKEEINYSVLHLKEELVSSHQILESLELELSKSKTDAKSELNRLSQQNNEKEETIKILNDQMSNLKTDIDLIQSSLNGHKGKISEMEGILASKNKELELLNESKVSQKFQIDSLNEFLKVRLQEELVKDKEIKESRERIEKMESEIFGYVSSLKELDVLVTNLKMSISTKELDFENLKSVSTSEIESLQQTVMDQKEKMELLERQLADALRDQESTVRELSQSNTALVDFRTKVLNLELVIQEEMETYEKVNEEYRHMEQESNQYKVKYTDLLKQNSSDVSQYQSTIQQLTDQIHKIEDERDEDVHQMEKLFNSKIFDLQQSLEDKSAELESMKKEMIESRKSSKTVRNNLELEKERLQKAITTRENQFSEEKAQILKNVEKERTEKLNYKTSYEDVIHRLENDLKNAEEKNVKDVNELKTELGDINERLKEAQLNRYRISEELKQKESEYKKNTMTLKNRIEQLEPLEKKIETLESTTHRLMSRLTELEENDNAKELQHLRSEIKVNFQRYKLLEKENQDLIGKMNDLRQNNNDLSKEKNKMKESNIYLQDQLQNFESLDKTRLDKIENINREIASIKSENESLKSRYLKLKEISETHLEKVTHSHEETINNYIERIGSLTKEIEQFQQQIQYLTVEKNMVKDENLSLKHDVAELNSKLHSLKSIVQEHTENTIHEKYEQNNRFTRMSSWRDKPNLLKRLPPVEAFDRETAAALNLDSNSKIRLESYVFSPYQCEDEPSCSIEKQMFQIIPGVFDNTHQNDDGSIDSKKKKEGFRQQITNKFRQSLQFHSSSESKSSKKKDYDEILKTPTDESKFYKKKNYRQILETPLKIKTEFIPKEKHRSSKPPLAPRKNINLNYQSDQLRIIDLDELRQRHDKTASLTPMKQENIYSVSSSTSSTVAPSTSIGSLVVQEDKINNDEKIECSNNAPHRQNRDSEIVSLDSLFTQKPKTPKPNSIIKKLIRKTKNKTPKRKQGFIEKLMQ